SNPGVYFRSTGWLERGEGLLPIAQMRTGVGTTLADLIAKYGEENGRYLFEELNRYEQIYRRLTFIETGLEPDGCFEDRARQEAVRRGWDFEKIQGDLGLFHRLVWGDWNDSDFLTVPPGARISVTYDDAIIAVERA